jgi:predicted RecB family endonuclease
MDTIKSVVRGVALVIVVLLLIAVVLFGVLLILNWFASGGSLSSFLGDPVARFFLLLTLVWLIVGRVGNDMYELQSTLDEKLTDLMKQLDQLQSELTEQLDQLQSKLAGDDGYGPSLADLDEKLTALTKQLDQLRSRIAG